MSLYRFLFAPVLLAVAVLSGSPEQPRTVPAQPPVAQAQRPAAAERPPLPAGGRRASRPHLRAAAGR